MRTIEITDIRKKRHTIVVESIDSFRELDMDEVHGLAEGTKIVYHSGNTSIAVITDMPYGMIETKVHGYYLHEESDSPGIQALIKERKEYLARAESHVGPDQHVVLTEQPIDVDKIIQDRIKAGQFSHIAKTGRTSSKELNVSAGSPKPQHSVGSVWRRNGSSYDSIDKYPRITECTIQENGHIVYRLSDATGLWTEKDLEKNYEEVLRSG